MNGLLRELDCTFIHMHVNDQVAIVGLAGDQINTATYILLQRTLHPSGQDVALGEGELHVTVCDESRSRYGGVKEVRLQDGHVVLCLCQDAAEDLRTERQVVIDITNANVSRDALLQALKAVCGPHVPVTEVGKA